MNEFYLKIDVPSFIRDKKIEEFFYQVAKFDKLIKYMNILE